MKDSLLPASVQESLATEWIGRPYLYLPTATSTNEILNEQVLSGNNAPPAAGTVLLADFQEKGRGRLGRSWEAPAGTSLLFSLLLRPLWPALRSSWLTMICGLAVSEAVEELMGGSARLKWPNDGVLGSEGSWAKYCGILSEGHIGEDGRLQYALMGIGVNVNIPQAQLPVTDFPATSLLAAKGRAVSRLQLFTRILSYLEQHYQLANEGLSPHKAWQDRLIYMNRRVSVSRLADKTSITGTAVGTDEQGRLLIQETNGSVHHVTAGDVTVRES